MLHDPAATQTGEYRAPPRSVHRFTTLVSSLSLLLAAGSCSPGENAPLAPASSSPVSYEVETLRVNQDKVDGLRLQGSVVRRGETFDQGEVRSDALDQAELLALTQRHFPRSTLPASSPARAPGDAAPLVERSVERTDDDGVAWRLVTFFWPGPASAPVAYVLLGNDTVRAIMDFPRPTRRGDLSRVLRFGPEGALDGMAILTRLDEFRDGLLHGTIGAMPEATTPFLVAACRSLVALAAPSPLHAQEEECVDYEVDVMFAMAAFVAAEGAALAACLPWGPVLPVPCIAALGALSTAAAYLSWVTYQYGSCLAGQGTPPSGSGPDLRAGDTQPIDDGCFYIDWEISYDGGQTWQFYQRQIIC